MVPAVIAIAFSVFGSRERLPAEVKKVPAGLSGADWSSIRTEYERSRRAASKVGDEYRARNPQQQWLARFDGRGFVVDPDGSKWRWGLELVSFGFAGHERPVGGEAKVKAKDERVTYAWTDSLEEWFVNDERGLEHGFTVKERPPGAGDRVSIRLGVRGGLRPNVQADRHG